VKAFLVLLALTMVAHAASSDPGSVAIEFLEKVREGKLNLEPGGDTALSPQTVESKRHEIAKRIERMAKELGSDPLEVSTVKEDGDFAGVLVRKAGGFDPSGLRVFPVALIRRDAAWEPAPVPASFENVGAGYAISLRNRVQQLENWMLREQVVDLQKLHSQAQEKIRGRIEAVLPESELRGFNVEQLGIRFLNSCEKGDLASLLGILGGLGAKLPDDWSSRLKSAENAIRAGSTAPRPWRLLTSPEVARVMVHHEDDDSTGLISIGCLDPLGNGKTPPRIELLHLGISKMDDGLWRINPPPSFLHPMAQGDVDPDGFDEDAILAPEKGPDSELIRAFPAAWSALHPPVPQASAELAAKLWVAALTGGSFPTFLSLSKLDGTSVVAAASCAKAAKVWGDLRKGSTLDLAVPLSFQADENSAAGIYQLFAARDPDKLNLRPFYFEKSTRGWLWNTTPSQVIQEKWKAWFAEETEDLAEVWMGKVLSDTLVVENLEEAEAPSEADTRKCVESWLEAVRKGDFREALNHVARLGGEKSESMVLKNLGYEIADARGKSAPNPVISIYREDPCSAAGVKIDRVGNKPAFPLYPVVKTPQGPRILIEVDLFVADRTRDYLNNYALVRLRKETSEKAEAALRNMIQKYKASVLKIAKEESQ
jgi:hypothetical protein